MRHFSKQGLNNLQMHSETLLSLFLPVLPTLLRSYPTGQAERKAARKLPQQLSHLNARKY
jgi:hypothetical protein